MNSFIIELSIGIVLVIVGVMLLLSPILERVANAIVNLGVIL